MDMNERLKLIRKDAHMTQDELAVKLSLTRNYVSLMEAGKYTPSDRTIHDYCRIFHVKEEWLRTGEGEREEFAGDDVGYIVADILENTDSKMNKLIISILEVYQGLNEANRKQFDSFIDALVDKVKEI